MRRFDRWAGQHSNYWFIVRKYCLYLGAKFNVRPGLDIRGPENTGFNELLHPNVTN